MDGTQPQFITTYSNLAPLVAQLLKNVDDDKPIDSMAV